MHWNERVAKQIDYFTTQALKNVKLEHNCQYDSFLVLSLKHLKTRFDEKESWIYRNGRFFLS